MKILDAFKLASQLHAGQVDKAGRPYIEHLSRVFLRVQAEGGNRDQQIAALLHDSIEDGKATMESLDVAGVPWPAIELVDALSKEPRENYVAYIEWLKSRPQAMLIKRADLLDNSDPVRLALLPAADQQRLMSKYRTALDLLETE